IGREALLGKQQLGEGGNAGQRVVELVRHTRYQLPDRGHLFGLDQLLLQHLLVGDVADHAQHFFIEPRRRVGHLNRADVDVLPIETRFEQAGLTGERLLEVRQRLGELVDRKSTRLNYSSEWISYA